jgi:hypothetical protein
MANQWQIPHEVELHLRGKFKLCAYCGRKVRAYRGVKGCPKNKATIEHLNRHGPFYWSDGLKEKHLVIVCAQCNSSRGTKRLADWFESSYCRTRQIGMSTVRGRVREHLRTALAKR